MNKSIERNEVSTIRISQMCSRFLISYYTQQRSQKWIGISWVTERHAEQKDYNDISKVKN